MREGTIADILEFKTLTKYSKASIFLYTGFIRSQYWNKYVIGLLSLNSHKVTPKGDKTKQSL